ncbi:MAG: hypothetical protein ACO3JG_11050 [Luteolibacter sp.]
MALAATAASSQAASVQITFTGNKISPTGGNKLNVDLTGDGFGDVTTSNTSIFSDINSARVWVKVNGGKWLGASYDIPANGKKVYMINAQFAGNSIIGPGDKGYISASSSPVSATYLNPISFQDAGINGGATTEAWLEVSAYADSTQQYVEFTRLIFNDDSTTRPTFTEIPGEQTQWQVTAIPEPGGFVATSLLLGAAGLIRRRQARAA